MKKLLEIALGIVTSVGGFLEIGSITTAAQGGAEFSFSLIWAIALGGLCVIFLVEQSGRFAAVSGRTIPDAIRERAIFYGRCTVFEDLAYGLQAGHEAYLQKSLALLDQLFD